MCMGYAMRPQNNETHGKANRKFHGIVFHFTHQCESVCERTEDRMGKEGQTCRDYSRVEHLKISFSRLGSSFFEIVCNFTDRHILDARTQHA